MNQRAAKKHATVTLSDIARRAAETVNGGDAFGVRSDPEVHSPSDRRRIARAYGELADELARRYDRRRPSGESVASDPDQLPLFSGGSP